MLKEIYIYINHLHTIQHLHHLHTFSYMDVVNDNFNMYHVHIIWRYAPIKNRKTRKKKKIKRKNVELWKIAHPDTLCQSTHTHTFVYLILFFGFFNSIFSSLTSGVVVGTYTKDRSSIARFYRIFIRYFIPQWCRAFWYLKNGRRKRKKKKKNFWTILKHSIWLNLILLVFPCSTFYLNSPIELVDYSKERRMFFFCLFHIPN